MKFSDLPIAEILAILGMVVGPFIAYLAAKRKIGAEVLLIDIETIKGWSEARKAFEAEIAELHIDLAAEQNLRRDDRTKYLEQIAKLERTIRDLEDRVQDCEDEEEN